MLSDGAAIVGQTLAGGFERYRLVTTIAAPAFRTMQKKSRPKQRAADFVPGWAILFHGF
jgi:hypothetical protein